jgi:hypothetical protein
MTVRTITENEYHNALVRFMLARLKQEEVDKLEREMNDFLGEEGQGCASDEIYSRSTLDPKADFDKALDWAKIRVESSKES